MNKKEIEILKKLGYVDTKESGAILEHPLIVDNCPETDKFVWADEKFDSVLSTFQHKLRNSLLVTVSNKILDM